MTESSTTDQTPHLVVALKYRPQSFTSLVGQDHIATALSNAIRLKRVGHAYLFTGARGVGKTSSARIFAKCLNCAAGPTSEPCEQCEACQAISVGEDIDVIEIDGASNRGIDEIRQLRANASIRPSRSPHKIYIIDEVHMLTKEAFNALLKTLEEPPGHVKFIFCTTDPEKIPITVLSRCQRFDFSPVQTTQIAQRLSEIATAEGVQVDDEALTLLARRANGSMRDSQSLLEQMLSFCDDRITAADVNHLLGTADLGRIAELAGAICQGQPGEALQQIHAGLSQGVDAGQMASQLLGYFRDLMAVAVGSDAETLLQCGSAELEELQQRAQQLGLETILAIVQILDGAVVRMQSSLHARTLLEAATVRLCHLEHLNSMADLVAELSAGGAGARGPAAPVKKNETPRPLVAARPEPRAPEQRPSRPASVSASPPPKPPGTAAATSPVAVPATSPGIELPAAAPQAMPPAASGVAPFATRNVEEVWRQMLRAMGDMTADMASDFDRIELADERHVVVTLNDKVNRDFCSKPERKQLFEERLGELVGQRIRVDFLASDRAVADHQPQPKLTRVQQIRKLEENDFVRETMRLFDAEITGFREPKSNS